MAKLKVPHPLTSEGNKTDHWSMKKARSDILKFLTKLHLNNIKEPIQLPCSVTLTRVAPRKLDDDNLRTAFKHVRDTIAAFIFDDWRMGRKDNDPRIKWLYAQKKGEVGEYAFEIEITQQEA